MQGHKVGSIRSYGLYVEDKQLVKPVRKIVKPIVDAFKKNTISRKFAYMLLDSTDLIYIDNDPYKESYVETRPLHKLQGWHADAWWL